jgi:hypothetical protein
MLSVNGSASECTPSHKSHGLRRVTSLPELGHSKPNCKEGPILYSAVYSPLGITASAYSSIQLNPWSYLSSDNRLLQKQSIFSLTNPPIPTTYLTNGYNLMLIKVLSAVAMKSSVFWDIMLCSPESQLFQRNILPPSRGWRVSQARNQHEAGSKQRLAYFADLLNVCLLYFLIFIQFVISHSYIYFYFSVYSFSCSV